MRKKILIAVMASILIIGSFAGGFYAGLNFFSKAFATSDLLNANVDLIPLQLRMEQLDRGDYTRLRESLNMQIDAEILRIYGHLDKAENQEEIKKAKGWLRRVAKHRLTHPPTYPGEVSTEEHKVAVERVGEILAYVMEEEENLTR